LSLTLIGSDFHAPYFNKKAFRKFVKTVQTEQPRRVILNGDWWDFYQMSTFDKDPSRLTMLQSDIDVGIDAIGEIREAAPNAELIVAEGNHEARLRRYLMRHPELSSLNAFDPMELFKLKQFKAKWLAYNKQYIVDGNLIIHGRIVKKRAGATAQANIEQYGMSVGTGHVHRLATIYRTINGETYTGAEFGCLCSLECEFMDEGTSDWQAGYGEIRDGVMRALPL
jgi:predicted phosphodiesterase